MATEFEGRKIDHEICEVVIPEAEKILSPYTYNNRKGKGMDAAINQLIDHIYEVTEGYTKEARIIKLDFKGFFPSALWDHAERCICDVIDTSDESDDRKAYLKWLTMIAIHCNPAAHCEMRTPAHFWTEHIEPCKSILTKPEGVGAAIGRLIWQTAMGLYVNDVIKWLTEECCIRLVCFVDDIVMVVPEDRHYYALSLIPEIRKRLAGRNVRLNEKKFYDQPYRHGLEFLGSHIRCFRLHLNNVTYNRAMAKVRETTPSEEALGNFVSFANSYTGLMKNRTDYRRLMHFAHTVMKRWGDYLEWDCKRKCFVCKDRYKPNERLRNKYNIKKKNSHDRRRKNQLAQ